MIHPTAIIEPGAQLGVDCEIMAGAVVTRHAVLADRVVVHPGAVVGGDPQYLKFDRATPSFVRVGEGTVIRENVTLNRAVGAGQATVVGARCFLMACSHVGHDCAVGDDVVLATKFRFTMPYGKGASRRHILRACEESLKRLRTDAIDLYQIHMQDLDVPEDETLRALDDLVHQGKVRYIGASNYAAWRLMDSLWTSETHGLARFIALQMQYNLVERNLEWELIPACKRFGLGVIPWSPDAAATIASTASSPNFSAHLPGPIASNAAILCLLGSTAVSFSPWRL
jgi:carbonic anhydrase/acetyltransferase-like protein (isoleucine patch superfamily)